MKSRLERQERKLYKKMMKNYRRILKDNVKEAGPWEGSMIHWFVVDYLKWMRDYYKLGVNVCGMEHKDSDPEFFGPDFPTRLDRIEEILKEWELYQDSNVNDKYYTQIPYELDVHKMFVPSEGGKYYTFDGDAWDSQFRPNGPWKTYNEAYDACKKEEEEHLKKFYELLLEHLPWLWD